MRISGRTILKGWLIFYDRNFQGSSYYQSSGDTNSYMSDGFSLRALRNGIENMLKVEGIPEKALSDLAKGLPNIMKDHPQDTCRIWDTEMKTASKPFTVVDGRIQGYEHISKRKRKEKESK